MSKQVEKKQGNLFSFLKGTKNNDRILEKRLLSSKEKSEEDKVVVVQRRVRKNGFDLPFGFF